MTALFYIRFNTQLNPCDGVDRLQLNCEFPALKSKIWLEGNGWKLNETQAVKGLVVFSPELEAVADGCVSAAPCECYSYYESLKINQLIG